MNAVILFITIVLAMVAFADRSRIASFLIRRFGEKQAAKLLISCCLVVGYWDVKVLGHYGKLSVAATIEMADALWQRGLPPLVGDRDDIKPVNLKDLRTVPKSYLLPLAAKDRT